MAIGSKVTYTVFFTLIFGAMSSALVNKITDSSGVHWACVFYHFEFYVLIVLGFVVIVLSKLTARESSEQFRRIEEKFDAVKLQGFLGGKYPETALAMVSSPSQAQPRLLVFSTDAEKAFDALSVEEKGRIMALLNWLKYASASEIVMRNNIHKVRSGNPQEFVVRVGRLRLDMDINLQDNKLSVKDVRRKLIT